MAKHAFRIGGERQPALDIVSYGRRGPGRPNRFTPDQVAQIGLTVRRAPEVMVKVSGGGKTASAVTAHFQYITRRGALEIEADDGERHQGDDVPAKLVEDWDLELDVALDRWQRMEHGGRVPQPKLVHNIVLSMPAGTLPLGFLRPAGSSPERSSPCSIAMPWCCTPTRTIRMCTSSSAPTGAKADD